MSFSSADLLEILVSKANQNSNRVQYSTQMPQMKIRIILFKAVPESVKNNSRRAH